jgi:hypothetical protein
MLLRKNTDEHELYKKFNFIPYGLRVSLLLLRRRTKTRVLFLSYYDAMCLEFTGALQAKIIVNSVTHAYRRVPGERNLIYTSPVDRLIINRRRRH